MNTTSSIVVTNSRMRVMPMACRATLLVAMFFAYAVGHSAFAWGGAQGGDIRDIPIPTYGGSGGDAPFSPWTPDAGWHGGGSPWDGPTCGDDDSDEVGCDDAELSIDNETFSWEGPALTGYNVTYCDGSHVSLAYEGETGHLDVFTLDRRIERVEVEAAHSCTRVATQECGCDDPEPELSCTISIAPSTITRGDHTELSWSSTGGERMTIQSIGDVEHAGSLSLAPDHTTTYEATVTSDSGETASCSTTVTVNETHNPWCSMGLSPSAITRGTVSTLWWDSNDMESVDIVGLGNGLSASNTSPVSPSYTTTYTGTFHIRGGGTQTCSATLTVEEPSNDPAPACTMNVSSSRVRPGESVTLSWTSDRATAATIDQGIGSIALDGSRDVVVDGDTTYTGTFTARNGRSVTCSAHVATRSGGGGACINCDATKKSSGGSTTKKSHNPSPNIVLAQAITKPGNYITLDQVPYTGFEASPLTTALFWMGIFIASAFAAYAMIAYDPFARLRYALVGMGGDSLHDVRDSALATEEVAIAPEVTAISYFAAAAQRNDDGVGMIENLAHEEHILLSPEAARMIMDACATSNESAQVFVRSLFQVAQAQYPREDGWILLTKERMQMVLGGTEHLPGQMVAGASVAPLRTASNARHGTERPQRQEREQRVATVNMVRDTAPINTQTLPQSIPQRAPQMQAARPVQQTQKTIDTTTVIALIDALTTNNQQAAFDLVRSFMTSGTTAESLIVRTVRMLDDVYKNRLEGNHNPDRDLAQKTATWSNTDFEQVLGMLVESIDRSYASNRVGTKVALAKLFDHFARMNG